MDTIQFIIGGALFYQTIQWCRDYTVNYLLPPRKFPPLSKIEEGLLFGIALLTAFKVAFSA